jgi:curli biogenesis system outer membrane secretion channel CsgG
MVGKTTVFMAGATLLLVAAAPPSALTQAQPGMWEISGAPGARTPVRQCVADIAVLARFEHRAKTCVAKIVKDDGSSTSIHYSCGGAGFGNSEIEVITPRSLRISTQGISDGLPFNYVLQARRIDDCSKSTVSERH